MSTYLVPSSALVPDPSKVGKDASPHCLEFMELKRFALYTVTTPVLYPYPNSFLVILASDRSSVFWYVKYSLPHYTCPEITVYVSHRQGYKIDGNHKEQQKKIARRL